MELLRWQLANSLKNNQYILLDSAKNAVLIDPIDRIEIERLRERLGFTVKALCITHEHLDHAGEAGSLQKLYNARVYASQKAKGLIDADVTTVANAETITISSELSLRLFETPGHTAAHAVFEAMGFLFSGDSLFHGGCGHCKSQSASLEEHFETLTQRLSELTSDLLVMPGHYYAKRNLEFALHVEKDNKRTLDLLSRLQNAEDELQHQTTLKQEGEYNPFLRLANKSLRQTLSELTNRNFMQVDDFTVFQELRSMRNSW